ncbi:MAG: hypothetical protein V4640_13390 [Verrucomicrobiota bacterium]
MKKSFSFLVLAASIGALSAETPVDCVAKSAFVKSAVAAKHSKVLEIVSAEVTASPSCACEVVKAAIEGSEADAKTVGAIVEAAAVAAPEQMRLVAQCAVAIAPDALAEVQAVMVKLDPNLGDSGSSAKGAKDPVGEVAAMPNPLDFPGQGPVGPTPGGPGGLGLVPIVPPVIIAPPDVTNVNP